MNTSFGIARGGREGRGKEWEYNRDLRAQLGHSLVMAGPLFKVSLLLEKGVGENKLIRFCQNEAEAL